MEDNEAEQSYLGSVTDTIESAYDTAAEYAGAAYDIAGQAFNTLENMVDTDHDGAVIDDVMGWGAAGAVTLGGSAAGALGGAVLGAAVTPELGGVGAVAGVGLGLEVGGEAIGYLAGPIGSEYEEVGDFMSDVMGTRSELPYGNDECTDPDYKDGRQGSADPDGGFGHQLNEYFTE
jgi:hypothetical protein